MTIINGTGVLVSRRHVITGAGTVGKKKDVVVPPIDESATKPLAVNNPGMGFNERDLPTQELPT